MKNILTTIFLAGLLLLSMTSFSQTTLKIGHVDLTKIMESLPERDTAAAVLERESESRNLNRMPKPICKRETVNLSSRSSIRYLKQSIKSLLKTVSPIFSMSAKGRWSILQKTVRISTIWCWKFSNRYKQHHNGKIVQLCKVLGESLWFSVSSIKPLHRCAIFPIFVIQSPSHVPERLYPPYDWDVR